jgi:hypothetical protein
MKYVHGILCTVLAFSALGQDPSPRVHVLVEMDGGADAARRVTLERSGVRLLAPVPGRGWYASVTDAAGFRPIAAEDKISEELKDGLGPSWARVQHLGGPGVEVDILYFEDVSFDAIEDGLRKLNAILLAHAPEFQRVTARISAERVRKLAAQDWVQFVEAIQGPKRTLNNAISAQMMKVDTIQQAPTGASGEGVRVGIFDGGSVDPHPDFGDRLTVVDRATRSSHSTHVAGTVAASGESDARTKGMAPRARVYSYTYSGDVVAKMRNAVRDYQLDLSQNSWGYTISEELANCSQFGYYGTVERDLDRVVWSQGLTVAFALGNDRDLEECGIPGRGGFWTASRPATAKNVISVGAIEQSTRMSEFGGYGPTRDGRLKPDVVALGVSVRSTGLDGGTLVLSGTSMSTPAVTGLLADMMERLRSRGAAFTPALVKGILLNTATDLGNPGPDYSYGFGIPNAVEAINVVDQGQFVSASIASGSSRHTIPVPGDAKTLRVMLAWTDPDAAPGAPRTLVNNLDLVVTAPDGTTQVLPLTLNPADPGADAKPGSNDRDPMEQIVVDKPAGGAWTAEVRASGVASGEQGYVVTWSFAEVKAPECQTTVVPRVLQLPETAGSAVLSVTRASTCGPWSAQAAEGWLNLLAPPERPGSGVVKLLHTANDSGAPRFSTVGIGDVKVTVRQLAQCVPASISSGAVLESSLSLNDCLTREGTFAKVYSFQAQAGQSASVSLASTRFDAYLELWGPGNVIIAANDDGAGGTDARIPPASGSLFLPFSGEYRIVATSYDIGEAGTFRLSFDLGSTPSGAGTDTPPKALDNCPASVDGQLGESSSTTGRRGDLYYTDAYVFLARAGQELTAEVAEAGFDSVMYLISPEGEIVSYNDDGGGSTTKAAIRQLIFSPGYWRLEVSTFAPQVSGPYKLNVNGCSAPQ